MPYRRLDDLEKENIWKHSTERLEYVLGTLNTSNELNEDLHWRVEIWPDCTIEELLGALIEAENLLDREGGSP